jgi:hypothetical protein
MPMRETTLRIAGLALNRTFGIWERLGIHITSNHFYQPIPDVRSLSDRLWTNLSELVGLRMNEEGQRRLLEIFSSNYRGEYESFPKERTPVPYRYYVNNGAFGSVDGELLYCMIRHYRPKRIIEIGSGNSTYLSAQATLRNREEKNGYKCELTAIEPYPNSVLKEGFPGLTRLVQKKVQNVSLSEFEELEENDILFIDSTHVLRIGSDVQYEYLEILPRLRKGVLVHSHDIFLPSEYPREWVLDDHKFWTEQYLLQAFITFNECFEVVLAASYVHLRRPEWFESAFSSYSRDTRWPSSFWMRRTR